MWVLGIKKWRCLHMDDIGDDDADDVGGDDEDF